MTNNSNSSISVTQPQTEQKGKEVKFTIPENWITSETRMMKRADHIQSELVELYRRCMMIVTETELLREGIEQVAKTVPTYKILEGEAAEEEKPEFNNIEDLEQEEEEIKEEDQGPKENETNNRMSSRGL